MKIESLVIFSCLIMLSSSAMSKAVCGDDENASFCLTEGNTQDNGPEATNVICGTNTNNGICQFALSVLPNLDQGVTNCYSHESANKAHPTPIIDVTGDPAQDNAQTDCSGWIDYVLTTAQSGSISDALGEINTYKTDASLSELSTGGGWPQAFVYNDYFTALEMKQNYGVYWSGFNDLKQLQPGDILSWCSGPYCEPASLASDISIAQNLGGDTGHIMVVVAVKQLYINGTNNDQLLSSACQIVNINAAFTCGKNSTNQPDDLENNDEINNLSFWAVGVVDSSSVPHGSSESSQSTQFEFPDDNNAVLNLTDQRSYSGGNLPTVCASAGGLGAGVIVIAQWTDKSGEMKWARSFKNAPNTTLYAKPLDTVTNIGNDANFSTEIDEMKISFGRVGNYAFTVTSSTDTRADFSNGAIVPDGTNLIIEQASSIGSITNGLISNISVSETGDSDNPYQISINGAASQNGSVDLTFLDDTGTSYPFSIDDTTSGTYTIPYNTTGPKIVSITINSPDGFTLPPSD